MACEALAAADAALLMPAELAPTCGRSLLTGDVVREAFLALFPVALVEALGVVDVTAAGDAIVASASSSSFPSAASLSSFVVSVMVTSSADGSLSLSESPLGAAAFSLSAI